MKLFDILKTRLADEYRKVSTWLAGTGLILMAAWRELPADTRAILPYADQMSLILFALVIVAKMTPQKPKS